MSDSWPPQGLQHTRLPCPSLSPEFAQTHVHWVSDAIQPSHPLWPPFSSCHNLSQHEGLFQRVSSSHQLAKYCSVSISPSNEYSGLISFGIDGFDLLTVQGTLKSLIKDHSPKASILWHSAFFMVQFLHPYLTTTKTIVLTIWIFVGKMMSLLFNTFCHSFSSKEQESFNVVAAITVHSYFGAQENNIENNFLCCIFLSILCIIVYLC